jgi:CubicO group peptidase (beta-lactamase class C family)
MKLIALTLYLALAACATVPSTAPSAHAEVGVAFDRNGDLASFADGMADPRSRRRVTIDDPVRVASVSKMVTAIGVMKLVDEGRLDLNRDVSDYLGWPLRNPDFPDRPITLAMLLAHISSVREHDDDYVVPLGQTLRQALSDPRNWDAKHGPGDGYFAYVNFNYPIIGSIIEKVTGERFDLWMHREVLAPMKLDACFNWPT